MLTKERAKDNLVRLIKKFESEFNSGRALEYNEEATKTAFIQPLLEDVLGWDVSSRDEVSPEENTSKGRVDYGLKIDGQIKVFVEAKPIKADLNKHIEQAVRYGYNRKDVPFVLLTDFEGLKLFDVTVKPDLRNPLKGLKLNLTWKQYLPQFDKLWLLGKTSVKAGELDKLLLIRPKERISVDKAILNDLKKWHESLARDIFKNNHKFFDSQYSEKDSEYLKEITQKILDRIIFMRSCEDRGLVHRRTLRDLFEERTEAVGTNTMLFLEEDMKHYNIVFDSDLFCPQEWEGNLAITFSVMKEIILETYNPYQFDVIPIEVFGNIYEQYLGYTIRLTDHQVKYELKADIRKAGGVYYTPEYIVGYIVKNTVGKLLQELSPPKIKKLRILDPACGSGSFLIRAYEEMLNYYRKQKKAKKITDEKQKSLDFAEIPSERYLTLQEKSEILRQHIFGVDIDEQAVEVTKLSLMLKMLEGEHGFIPGRAVLPMLDRNIRCGNSLISGEVLELKEFFGDEWYKVKPFNWGKEFKEILVNESGFDVVIGNPPYVKARDYDKGKEIYRDYLNNSNKYETLYKMWDLYIPFVEKGTKLLKKDGVFGMIVPDTIEKSDYALLLREYLVKNLFVYQIDFFPFSRIFVSQNKVVGIKNTIIFAKKSRKTGSPKRIFHNEEYRSIAKKEDGQHDVNLFLQTTLKVALNKVDTIPLGDICFTSYGLRLNSDKSNRNNIFKKADLLSDIKTKIHIRKFTAGKNLSRYQIKKSSWVEWNTERCPALLVRPTFPELYLPNKLLLGRQTKVAAFDEEGYIVDNTVIVCIPYIKLRDIENNNIKKYFSNLKKQRRELERLSAGFDLRFTLGIINSRLIKYYINFLTQNGIDMFPDDWKKLPIPANKDKAYNDLVALVDIMSDLNKKILSVKGNEKEQIQRQIEKTDKEIDDLDLPPKKWTQRRVGGSITASS